MAENPRVRFGLKNVHYAIITENEDETITYSKPKRMKGAINLVLTAKGDKAELFADDSLYYVSYANQGYDGTLELAIVQDDFKIDVLGHKKDANGVLFENANAIPNKIALLFEINTDQTRRRFVFYNIDVSRPNFETKTTTQTIEPKTSTLNLTISPLDDGTIKSMADPSSAQYDTWYDAVYMYKEAVSGASLALSKED